MGVMKIKLFLKLLFQWIILSIVFFIALQYFVPSIALFALTSLLALVFVVTIGFLQIIRFAQEVKKHPMPLVAQSGLQNVPYGSVPLQQPQIQELKKSPLLSFLKMILVIVLVIEILFAVVLASGYTSMKDGIIKDFFGGNVEEFNKYLSNDAAFNQSSAGDWSKCLKLDPKDKQFCLWIASGEQSDSKICDNMDPAIYPPDHMYSQETCYVDVAVVKNDKSVCDRVANKDKCTSLFARIDAQRVICEPLFTGDKTPSPSDCYDYAVSLKTKAACDGLIPAGGQNWKEICDIRAGLVSTSTLSIVPKKIGDCVMTKVSIVGSAVGGSEGAATAIEYMNGVRQFSVEKIDQVNTAKVGDIVRVCLQALPGCSSNWKYDGNVYDANNMDSRYSWILADSIKSCPKK